MASASKDNGLTNLGKGIYIIKPEDTGRRENANGPARPTVILIFGWMGARVNHLQKYAGTYQTMYPDATILLVRSDPSSFWTRQARRRANLAPLVEALEALGCVPGAATKPKQNGTAESESAPPRILVHAFSNGGAHELVTLSSLLADKLKGKTYPDTNLAPSAIIFDSCPGDGGLKGTQNAFLTAIRNPILKQIASFFITLLYVYGIVMTRVFGVQSVLTQLKAAMNKPKLLPWFSASTPRLYMYSDTDALIPHTEVETHAEGAKKAGIVVRLEKFENSAHVSHARTYPERYWAAVKQLWEDAVASFTNN